MSPRNRATRVLVATAVRALEADEIGQTVFRCGGGYGAVIGLGIGDPVYGDGLVQDIGLAIPWAGRRPLFREIVVLFRKSIVIGSAQMALPVLRAEIVRDVAPVVGSNVGIIVHAQDTITRRIGAQCDEPAHYLWH